MQLGLVWNNTIIDGHHRYAICTKYNIPFETTEVQALETELDVKLWMINNQFSRRNLPSIVRMDLVLQRKSLEEKKAKSRQGTRTDLIEDNSNIRSLVTLSSEQGKSLELAAKSVGLGYGTVHKTKKYSL